MSSARSRKQKLSVENLEVRDVPSVSFPAGANVVDVASQYGATPNDGIDDTVAIQRAVNDYMTRDAILYFRDGLYDLSAPIDYALANRGERGLWLQGQSESGTIFRWGNNLPAFNTLRYDQDGNQIFFPAIDTFNGNNGNAFGNYLHDFTVEVGAGNPYAEGIQYQTNNYGSLRNVTIKTLDPNKIGRIGLNIIFNEPGPMLISNLTVDGFNQGVLAGPQTYSAVFDGLTLMNQREAGFANYRLPVSINNFTSINSVPAYVSISSYGWGNTVITNANFSGGAVGSYAVVNQNNPASQGSAGNVTLRNVTASGYDGVLDDQVAGRRIVGPTLTEYITQSPLSLVPGSPSTTLNLPIEPTPTLAEDPVANWVSVTDFGANPYDEQDDSAAIQRALNSGAKTIYFPNPARFNATTGQFEGGAYRIGQTLTVGGNVERIAGLYSQLRVMNPLYGTDAPIFRVVDGNATTVQIDGFTIGTEGGGGGSSYGFGHDTTRTLVLKDILGGGYRNSVRGGKVFVENMCGTDLRFSGQQVWMRQINPEETVDRAKIVNDGGDLWILGIKTEGRSTQVNTINGGRTEILGGNLYNVYYIPSDYPAFTTTDSSLSFTIAETNFIYSGKFNTWVRDTRDGVTRDLTLGNTPINGARSGAATIGLYTDRIVDATAPSSPTNLRVSSSTFNSVKLNWDAAAESESFVRAYRVYRNGTFIGAAGRGVTTFTDVNRPDGTAATYTVLAENAAGLRSEFSNSLTASTIADTSQPSLVVASATPYRGNQVIVSFSEPIAAPIPGNFSIDNGVTVIRATLTADGKTVTVTTSALSAGTQYTLSINGLRDRATTPNTIAPTVADFSYRNSAGGVGLTGSYFANNNFTGTPIARQDATIEFDWGYSSPGVSGIGAELFSVRWTGQIEAKYSELYTFTMVGDDRITLKVNGQTIINRGFYSPSEFTGTIALEAGKRYDIEVTVAEDFGGAGARLWWQSASQVREIVPASQLFPTAQFQTAVVRTGDGRGADTRVEIQDNGLKAEFFDNATFSGTPVFTRNGVGINEFWGESPGSGIPADNFSVRWTGLMLPQFSEDYTFSALPDDVFRLWVNDQLILDRQTWSPTEIDSIPIRLTAGVPATIRVDYVETGGPGTAVLFWRSPSQVKDYPRYLPTNFADYGSSETAGTINRANFSFAGSMIGLRFDLAGVDLANNRIIDSSLGLTVGAPSGAEISLQSLSGVNDSTPNQLWAESGPNRARWATFPGNSGGNYSFAGTGSTPLGTITVDNTNYQRNGVRDGVRFQSNELSQFLQADTDGVVSLIVKRVIPAFFGDFNVQTKEYLDGSYAPSLRLTLAPKVTAAPLSVDLIPAFDSGTSDSDDVTSRNNSSPDQALRFRVSGTTVGAIVTLYADGVAIGSAVATSDTTEVLTFGTRSLLDGVRSITARQTIFGVESGNSTATLLTIDTGNPTAAIAVVAPSPRNTPVDSLTVTFSEAVTGVDLSDFTLNGTSLNLTAATLTGVGSTYTIGNLAGLTAAEGSYSLTLTAIGSGIGDTSGNLLLANTLSAWAVDLTAPRPMINPVTPSVRNTSIASVSINFTEAVSGFDISDISLTLNGTAISLAAATMTGSGASFTLGNLSGLTAAEGDYVLTLNPTGAGIVDAAGNELVDAASVNWSTDTTAPIAEFASVTPDLRTTPVPSLSITFSESITGLDLGDFDLTRNGVDVSLSGATLTSSGAVYTFAGLTAATTSPGSYSISVRSLGTGIADAAGNGLAGSVSTSWTVASTAGPRVASITRLDPNPTNADTVRFAVTFTEAVTGVDASDFQFRFGNGLNEADLLSVSGSGSAYTVTTSTGIGNGTLRLDLVDNDSIAGLTGVKLGGTGLNNGSYRRGETYTIDRVAPRVTGISSVSPNPRRTPVDSLTVTFSEALHFGTLDVSDLSLTSNGGPNLIGTGVTITPTGARTFRIDGLTSLTAASGNYLFRINATGVTDVAGNAGTNSLSRSWTRETPRVTSIERLTANPTNSSTATYRVTLIEAVTGLDAADFRLTTSSGLSNTSVSGVSLVSTSQYLVTVNTGNGSGTLRLDFLAAGSGVIDLFGNSVTADFTRGQVYTIDRVPPIVRSISGIGRTTDDAVESLTVTFSEVIDPATFTLSNLSLRQNGQSVNLSGVTIAFVNATTFRVDGLCLLTSDVGDYEFGVNLAGIRDRAGNIGSGLRTQRWTKTA